MCGLYVSSLAIIDVGSICEYLDWRSSNRNCMTLQWTWAFKAACSQAPESWVLMALGLVTATATVYVV